MHSAPYFSAFGLLTILHAARVIGLRRKHKVSLGHGEIPELEKLIRVFGNHSEYVPIGLLLLLGLEMVQAPSWYIHLSGMLLLTGRVLHAIGLGKYNGISKGRFYGMVMTFASLFLGSIGVTLFMFLEPSL